MNYKIEGAIRRNRKNFILFAILWIFLAIVFVAPWAYSSHVASESGKFDIAIFLQTLGSSISNPFETFGNVFNKGAIESYFTTLIIFTVVYVICFFIGMLRAMPKNEYSDIEHGSSDWSQRGEQYQILSKTKGIILAEDNYLPVDKRGNVNVLVVGRIRFW